MGLGSKLIIKLCSEYVLGFLVVCIFVLIVILIEQKLLSRLCSIIISSGILN